MNVSPVPIYLCAFTVVKLGAKSNNLLNVSKALWLSGECKKLSFIAMFPSFLISTGPDCAV
jgi:hypothetical protein